MCTERPVVSTLSDVATVTKGEELKDCQLLSVEKQKKAYLSPRNQTVQLYINTVYL